jgi:type IV pilus assembly protein PilE
MRMYRPPRHSGFTLVETMITVAIVAILAAIAVASYSSYVRQANRSDATRTMIQDAQSLQRCYSQNFTYLPATPCATTAGTTNSSGGYYSVTITIPTAATSYTIKAIPITVPQTKDTQCASFTLTSSGTQSAVNSAGTDATKTCWGSTN